MKYFEEQNGRLIGRSQGETVIVTPWGEDSLRVQAALQHEVRDDRFALLEPAETKAVVTIEDTRATVQCGKITALLEVHGWKNIIRISFYNQKGELLLRETDAANALTLRARKFEPHIGGDFALSVTFEGREGEHLYGMGQYQEDYLDW